MENFDRLSLGYMLRGVSSHGIHYSLVKRGDWGCVDLLLGGDVLLDLLWSEGNLCGGVLMGVLNRMGDLGYEVLHFDGGVLVLCVNVGDDRFGDGELIGKISLVQMG